jgi:hypothetical protein
MSMRAMRAMRALRARAGLLKSWSCLVIFARVVNVVIDTGTVVLVGLVPDKSGTRPTLRKPRKSARTLAAFGRVGRDPDLSGTRPTNTSKRDHKNVIKLEDPFWQSRTTFEQSRIGLIAKLTQLNSPLVDHNI